jgi:hypothetical protein
MGSMTEDSRGVCLVVMAMQQHVWHIPLILTEERVVGN